MLSCKLILANSSKLVSGSHIRQVCSGSIRLKKFLLIDALKRDSVFCGYWTKETGDEESADGRSKSFVL
jgi:hypothetical protein